MSSLRKQSTTYGAPFLFLGGLIVTLVGITTIYAANQVEEVKTYIEASQNAIQRYEQSGDYATALEISRNSYETLQKMGAFQDAEELLQTVKSLEEKLLTYGSSRILFNERGQPRDELVQLLKILGMPHLNSSENSVKEINAFAQAHLLRRGERWDEQATMFEAFKPIITPLLDKLGFVRGVFPHFKEYKGALVPGALLSRVRLRLQEAVDAWKAGVRFECLYFLSGERLLESKYENVATFMDDSSSSLKIRKDWTPPEEWPKTESEMTRLVWEQSEIPEDMRAKVTVHFINAPMKQDPKSEKMVRPTTEDTVESWLKESPSYGCYLVFSNQPFNHRQDMVIRANTPAEKYSFDTVGSAVGPQVQMAIIVDEVARTIFQFQKNQKSN